MVSFVPAVNFTIGSVVGRLLDAPPSGKSFRYYLGGEPNTGYGHTLYACFYNDCGKFYLCNVNDNDDSVLVLSAARNGNKQPKTILIPGNCEYNVTSFFMDCAKKHIDTLTLFSSELTPYANKSGLGDMYITFSASGRDIGINGGYCKISDFFSVYVGEDFIVIDSAGRPLVRVLSLSLIGNVAVTMENMIGDNSASPFLIPLPYKFRAENMVDLSLVCQIGGFSSFSKERSGTDE